jgi:DNA-directed RNA polymerase specialized sigma24 family protein
MYSSVENPVRQEDRDAGVFPSTHWSTVTAAGWTGSLAGQSALGRVIERYRRPLLLHLCWRFQASTDQAEDWLHSFVEKRILKKEILRQAEQQRGRFRTFLLTALDHFVRDELRHATRISRVPSGGLISLDDLEADPSPCQASSQGDPFDCAWMQTVLAEALDRLREFYLCKGRHDLWGVFTSGLVEPMLSETPAPSMEILAERCGFSSARQASNGLTTAKRMFKQILGAIIAEYARDQGAVAEEIKELGERLTAYKS